MISTNHKYFAAGVLVGIVVLWVWNRRAEQASG